MRLTPDQLEEITLSSLGMKRVRKMANELYAIMLELARIREAMDRLADRMAELRAIDLANAAKRQGSNDRDRPNPGDMA